MTTSNYQDMKSRILEEYEETSHKTRVRLQELRLKAGLAKLELREKYDAGMKKWDSQYSEFKKSLAHARSVMPEDWDEAKKGLNDAWTELKASCQRIEKSLLGKDKEKEQRQS